MNERVDTADSKLSEADKKFKMLSSELEIGALVPAVENFIPPAGVENMLLCNGGNVSKSSYPKLWEKMRGYSSAISLQPTRSYIDVNTSGVDSDPYVIGNLVGQYNGKMVWVLYTTQPSTPRAYIAYVNDSGEIEEHSSDIYTSSQPAYLIGGPYTIPCSDNTKAVWIDNGRRVNVVDFATRTAKGYYSDNYAIYHDSALNNSIHAIYDKKGKLYIVYYVFDDNENSASLYVYDTENDNTLNICDSASFESVSYGSNGSRRVYFLYENNDYAWYVITATTGSYNPYKVLFVLARIDKSNIWASVESNAFSYETANNTSPGSSGYDTFSAFFVCDEHIYTFYNGSYGFTDFGLITSLVKGASFSLTPSGTTLTAHGWYNMSQDDVKRAPRVSVKIGDDWFYVGQGLWNHITGMFILQNDKKNLLNYGTSNSFSWGDSSFYDTGPRVIIGNKMYMNGYNPTKYEHKVNKPRFRIYNLDDIKQVLPNIKYKADSQNPGSTQYDNLVFYIKAKD